MEKQVNSKKTIYFFSMLILTNGTITSRHLINGTPHIIDERLSPINVSLLCEMEGFIDVALSFALLLVDRISPSTSIFKERRVSMDPTKSLVLWKE